MVLATQQSALVSAASPEMIASWSQSAEERQLLQALAPQSLLAVPLRAHGELLGAIVLVSSTSSRRYGAADLRLAEALAQRAALSIENARLYRLVQDAIRARDEVLGIVAHDLRNPLAGIVMQARPLRRRALDVAGKPADVIEGAATRMHRLIQDLLDVTRIEGAAVDRPGPRGRGAGDRGGRRGPSTARRISGSRDRARCGAGSSRRVRGSRSTAPSAREPHHQCHQVHRTWWDHHGWGSVPTRRDPVHGCRYRHRDRLRRSAPSVRSLLAGTEGRSGGRGLGLPIVKGIIEAHGGRIWVKKRTGTGTIFSFTIPIASPVEEPAVASESGRS